MENSAKENILRSWKEIANYLGYDQRTCYRWEQRFGLPVHRAEGGAAKSRVIAYKDELDRWFQATFVNSSHPVPANPAPRIAVRRLLLGIVPVAAVAAYLIVRAVTAANAQPADFHIRGSTLIILNESGKEIWRRDTKIDGLLDETKYRLLFQFAHPEAFPSRLPSLVIKDIDGDGRNEVLIAAKTTADALGEGTLLCYDSRGTERWRFQAGRELTYGGRVCPADYRIYGFTLYDINRDGRSEIFVSSFNYPWEPCQIAVLDARGNLIGEFWNAGYVMDIVFADLDGDGREELYAAGVNNEYGGGFLAVFDPAHIRGASPQGPRYSFAGLEPGSEVYYIDFPRSDVSLADGSIVAGNARIEAMANRRLRIVSHMDLMYEFAIGMRCMSVRGSHGFVSAHKRFAAEGKVHSTIGDAYYEDLRSGLRYWDGSKWVLNPTPDLRNVRTSR